MITLKDYYMGRDEKYKTLLTPQLRANAALTVGAANLLLSAAASDGVYLEVHPVTRSLVSSGWRPPAVNALTPGAAVRSKHMNCEAIDLYDSEGDLDAWCMDNLYKLEGFKLWLEHPGATKGWCHLQIIPPRSGNRVYYP